MSILTQALVHGQVCRKVTSLGPKTLRWCLSDFDKAQGDPLAFLDPRNSIRFGNTNRWFLSQFDHHHFWMVGDVEYLRSPCRDSWRSWKNSCHPDRCWKTRWHTVPFRYRSFRKERSPFFYIWHELNMISSCTFQEVPGRPSPRSKLGQSFSKESPMFIGSVWWVCSCQFYEPSGSKPGCRNPSHTQQDTFAKCPECVKKS